MFVYIFHDFMNVLNITIHRRMTWNVSSRYPKRLHFGPFHDYLFSFPQKLLENTTVCQSGLNKFIYFATSISTLLNLTTSKDIGIDIRILLVHLLLHDVHIVFPLCYVTAKTVTRLLCYFLITGDFSTLILFRAQGYITTEWMYSMNGRW